MNISPENFKKPTPKIARAVGNGFIFGALAVQPLIAEAGDDIISHRAKFYITLTISFIAGMVKGFTMMIAADEKPEEVIEQTIEENGNNTEGNKPIT